MMSRHFATAAVLFVLLFSISALGSPVRYAALVSTRAQYEGALIATEEASPSGYTLALDYNITDTTSSVSSARYAVDPYTQCPQRTSSELAVSVIEALPNDGSAFVRSVSFFQHLGLQANSKLPAAYCALLSVGCGCSLLECIACSSCK